MRRSRIILGLLLVYQTLFLNVLLPGHTRGSITLDGKHSPAPCCCCCGGNDSASSQKNPATPSKRDREQCAICQFAAGLTMPPVLQLTLPELGLLEMIPVASSRVIISLVRISTYFACGPPLSAARFHA